MDAIASPPKVRMPSIELNMSLIGSPYSPDPKKDNAGEAAVQDAMTQAHPHEALLKEATKWVRELEAVRDDLYMLSVKNAILLDSLAMAGATEGCL
jgi:hypothetical protein